MDRNNTTPLKPKKMKTTYNGVTTEISNRLFEPLKITKNPPKVSYKFDALSLYYDGKYYFPKDLKKIDKENYDFEIQVVYHSYKWFQDTHYLTKQFADFLLQYVPEPKQLKINL